MSYVLCRWSYVVGLMSYVLCHWLMGGWGRLGGCLFVVTTLVVSGFWVDYSFDKETAEAPK
ncbi:MAG: hypothetical protein ACRC8Y_26030 [Chroococcales cyanobacterium]